MPTLMHFISYASLGPAMMLLGGIARNFFNILEGVVKLSIIYIQILL